ncbi:DEAD/DEAH box helicase [Sphingobium sp. AN558]|uniref:DEAD/DEAH box helicase n=1 Tax=Sphingobium sp. AN558 TaxID=3133442 RepID=UPI0030BC0EED
MSEPHSMGETALMIWAALQKSDVIYLADDDQQAEALAQALGALAAGHPVTFVPSSDALPGDHAPASPANIGRRIAALRDLRRINHQHDRAASACIISGEAAARIYPEPLAFDAAPPTLHIGDPIDASSFTEDMKQIGYIFDDRVDEPGEVAVLGDVVDIFPADAGMPARIEIADGRIASIRSFDPLSQLSVERRNGLEIGRAREPEADVGVGILAHLDPGIVMMSAKADQRRRRFTALATEVAHKDASRVDALTDDAWAEALKDWSVVAGDHDLAATPRFAETRSPLASMARFVKPLLADRHALLLVGSERDIRFLRPRIEKKLKVACPTVEGLGDAVKLAAGSAAAIVAPVDRGAMSDRLVMIAAADLLGSRAIMGDPYGPAAQPIGRGGEDIRSGDVVVHEDHGVGRVVGLEPAPGDDQTELIALEYAGGARRLVQVAEAGRIWRYGADADAVKLDRLDGSSWQKRRGDIDEAVAQSAAALLALAGERARLEAPVLEPDPASYERFVSGFPFNETADQARAIQMVRDDLASGRPMDRLVIGDVGYGKTEVALRAAALAALAGFQVIVAAPTTVLVRQHLQTFERRFAGTGIAVAGLSRLSSTAEKKAVKAGLADGSIHIVIGTGAVIAKDVRYAKLGLVIIDEEQRFGAADKTKLRGQADVHLLTLSATPIPRTLHRAMIGLQQISIIATPPARRQPIRTSLAAPDDGRIRTALLRERERGGQSFVVVPRIEDLAPLSDRLRRILPDLRLVEAHGKMPAAQIDAAMVGFAEGEGDILLATNIIEAGLDVPRANTMIVWRADHFGLAQLHQLRGRVGRGNRRGQVMLLTEGEDIAPRTMKRLRTLATYDRLGAGFAISAEDLDQRGGGDLLSDTQAGHMKLIGVDLYQRLFEAALKQARGEDAGLWVPDIRIGPAGALPADWIPEPDVRLSLYVRLARIADEATLDAFEEELVDRFGSLPPAACDLVTAARIAMLARVLHISRVDAGPAAIALTPRQGCPVKAKEAGLEEKDGRLLLREASAAEGRPARVTELLETISAAAS